MTTVLIAAAFVTSCSLARELARDFLRPALARRHKAERDDHAADREYFAKIRGTA